MILEHHPEADTDEDGVLSKEEARAIIHSLYGDHHGMDHADMLSDKHLAMIIERHPEADSDEDGVLSKEEAKAFIHARHRAHGDLSIGKGHGHHGEMHNADGQTAMAHTGTLSEEHLAMILEHHPEADTDEDGDLSKEEAKAFIHSLHGDHHEMGHADMLSEEHLAVILEHHPDADADEDGVLSKEEAQSFIHSLHGDHRKPPHVPAVSPSPHPRGLNE